MYSNSHRVEKVVINIKQDNTQNDARRKLWKADGTRLRNKTNIHQDIHTKYACGKKYASHTFPQLIARKGWC